MYILENNNKLSSAVKRSFSDLKLTERKHLQEWIAPIRKNQRNFLDMKSL